MKAILLILLTFLSTQALSLEDQEITEIFESHFKHGHLTVQDVDAQKFELINSKNFHIKRHVRGVASQLNEKYKKLKLKNPLIEISVD